MTTMRVQSGATERLESLVTAEGFPATGLTDVLLTLRRVVDGYFLDFDDGVFKSSGWTEREHAMEEVDATTAPGMYQWAWNTTGHNDGQYTAHVTCVSGHNVPQVCDLHVGEFVDHIDAPISAVPGAVLDETLAGHLAPGTVGHALLTGLGVPQQNVLLDGGAGHAEIVYSADGLMTTSRLRIFATPAAAIAATPGAADGADSEIALITYTGIAHGTYPKLPGTYSGVGS